MFGCLVDINECLNEDDSARKCHSILGVCENIAGSYKCSCNEGYIGDGFVCEGENKIEHYPTHYRYEFFRMIIIRRRTSCSICYRNNVIPYQDQ